MVPIMGEMEDWTLEDIDWDAEPFSMSIRVPKRPMCRFCGKKKLRWEMIGGRWILYEKKAPHRCPNHPLPLDILKKLAEVNITKQWKKK